MVADNKAIGHLQLVIYDQSFAIIAILSRDNSLFDRQEYLRNFPCNSVQTVFWCHSPFATHIVVAVVEDNKQSCDYLQKGSIVYQD